MTPKRSIFGLLGGSKKSVVVDSCALIDGRILELASSGFLPEKILLPQFVIRELQLLADGNDAQKRERARYGLDVAKKLQELVGVNVEIDRSLFNTVAKTDDQLLKLAKRKDAFLFTIDFNLIKVAELEGVKVLNINALTQNLRPSALPGEVLNIKIMQKGSNRGQGVGYMDDGTMVVVDQAQRLIGQTVVAEVDRMLNTQAGKMIFAKLVERKQIPKAKQVRKTNQDDGFVSDLRSELNS